MSGEPAPESRMHDVLGAFFGLLGGFVLASIPWQVESADVYPFYKGPMIFPLGVSILMVLAGLPSLFRLFRPREGALWRVDGGGKPVKPLVVGGLLTGFVLGLGVIGLAPSTFLFLVLSLRYSGHRGILRGVLLPAIVAGVLVLTFKSLLDVWFPDPWLWERMGL
jgi:hypothetical protein